MLVTKQAILEILCRVGSTDATHKSRKGHFDVVSYLVLLDQLRLTGEFDAPHLRPCSTSKLRLENHYRSMYTSNLQLRFYKTNDFVMSLFLTKSTKNSLWRLSNLCLAFYPVCTIKFQQEIWQRCKQNRHFRSIFNLFLLIIKCYYKVKSAVHKGERSARLHLEGRVLIDVQFLDY